MTIIIITEHKMHISHIWECTFMTHYLSILNASHCNLQSIYIFGHWARWTSFHFQLCNNTANSDIFLFWCSLLLSLICMLIWDRPFIAHCDMHVCMYVEIDIRWKMAINYIICSNKFFVLTDARSQQFHHYSLWFSIIIIYECGKHCRLNWNDDRSMANRIRKGKNK